MTRQHPRASVLEAAAQAAVGVPIGFAGTFTVGLMGLSAAQAPELGGPTFRPTSASASLITLAMFLLSTVRGYVIRRRFDRERAL